MDAFADLFGDRRGYRPQPGETVFHACAWPNADAVGPRRRGPYRDYAEAHDVAVRIYRGLARDGWLLLVEECRVEASGDVVVVESTPASQTRA